jgi:hypothetical protein
MDFYRYIGLSILLVLLYQCNPQKETNTMEKQSNYIENHLGEHELQREKDRLSQLMKSFRKSLEKIETEPKPQEIKALYGEGFKVKDEPVTCMVYIFERQQQHKDAQVLVKKFLKANSREVITSSNGRLFFLGFLTEDSSHAIYTLNDLASTFAGEE